MNFGRMNDNYYQPADDTAWDRFVDEMDEAGLDPQVESFEDWLERKNDEADDAAGERYDDPDDF